MANFNIIIKDIKKAFGPRPKDFKTTEITSIKGPEDNGYGRYAWS